MAQQPNVELTPGDLPKAVLEPAPARRQRIPRPGVITTPDEKPEGPGFGTPGPDTGWALRIINQTEIPDTRLPFRRLLSALMGARAAYFGRAPIYEDLQVALALTGYGPDADEALAERRERWVTAMAHEKSPGRKAIAEAGDELYRPTAEILGVSR